MEDAMEEKTTPTPNWLERLGQVLLRDPNNRKELIEIIRAAEQQQILDSDALNMIEGVLNAAETRVSDIMIPRSQMVVVQEDQTPEVFLPIIIESAHSRFPVMSHNRNEIMGILLAKDLLSYAFHQGEKSFDIRDVLRPAVFIPESKRLNVLLREFRANRNHIAMVVDEYGNTTGLVTIEDVLEQIVGDIEDEYDIEEDPGIRATSPSKYRIKGTTPIEEFNEYFGANLDTQEFDTIGGLVSKLFGRLPKRGEKIKVSDFVFKVLNADNRRIRLLQAYLPKIK